MVFHSGGLEEVGWLDPFLHDDCLQDADKAINERVVECLFSLAQGIGAQQSLEVAAKSYWHAHGKRCGLVGEERLEGVVVGSHRQERGGKLSCITFRKDCAGTSRREEVANALQELVHAPLHGSFSKGGGGNDRLDDALCV